MRDDGAEPNGLGCLKRRAHIVRPVRLAAKSLLW